MGGSNSEKSVAHPSGYPLSGDEHQDYRKAPYFLECPAGQLVSYKTENQSRNDECQGDQYILHENTPSLVDPFHNLLGHSVKS